MRKKSYTRHWDDYGSYSRMVTEVFTTDGAKILIDESPKKIRKKIRKKSKK